MKEMNEYEVRNHVESHPDTSLISYIFLTTLAEYSDVRKGMHLGADDYLIKPFDGIIQDKNQTSCHF